MAAGVGRRRAPARAAPGRRPDRPPALALPPRRHLRAQLPRPGRPRPGAAGCSASAATPATGSSGSGSSRSPRGPSGSGPRQTLSYVGRREPEGVEQLSLYPGHVVIRCETPGRRRRAGAGLVVADGLPVLARGRAPRRPAPVTAPGRRRHPPRPRATRWRWCSRSTASASPRWPRGCPTCASRSTCRTAPWALLLLGIAVGSMVGMPASGHLIERWGAGAVVRSAPWSTSVGLVARRGAGDRRVGAGRRGRAARLRLRHRRLGRRDERRRRRPSSGSSGRSIMPRFHAGWSLGTFTGAGVGAVAAGLGVPLAVHYAVAPAAGGRASRWSRAARLLPGRRVAEDADATASRLGLARAAHAGDRLHGAGVHAGRGCRQRLARARARRRVRRPPLGRRARLRAVRGRDDARPARSDRSCSTASAARPRCSPPPWRPRPAS